MSGEPISAAICTRNRGAAVLRAARSILANDHPAFRLIVVDQSTDDATERSLAPVRGDPRLTYVRSSTVGVSTARNEALRWAETEVVALTDDDCEVSTNWLTALQRIFQEHPQVALAFCSVRAGPFVEGAGFVPAYECRGTRVVRNFWGKCRARGMGAGLAVRRRVVLETLGGFDEMLGPGGVFPSCEEGDLAVRALMAGFALCETDRTYVTHHGFRSWSEGRTLGRRDFSGIGAAYAKALRAGHWAAMPVPIYELVTQALWPPVKDALQLRPPRGVARGWYFLSGMAQGFRVPLDRRRLLYCRSLSQES